MNRESFAGFQVILGTHLVMADGGLMALSGARSIAMAAKHNSVPVSRHDN